MKICSIARRKSSEKLCVTVAQHCSLWNCEFIGSLRHGALPGALYENGLARLCLPQTLPGSGARDVGLRHYRHTDGYYFSSGDERILDEVVTGHHPERLLPLVWWPPPRRCCKTCSIHCAFYSTIPLSKKSFSICAAIYIRHIQSLPLRWFDNRATGDLMTRILEDVTSVERVLIDGIEQGTVAVFTNHHCARGNVLI